MPQNWYFFKNIADILNVKLGKQNAVLNMQEKLKVSRDEGDKVINDVCG